MPGFGLHHQLHDLVEPAGEARHQGGAGARRQLAGDLVDPLADELAGAVVVGVGLELDAHLRHAGLGGGADAPHLGQAGQRHLQGDRDAGLQLLGAHRRVLDEDAEDRRREVGKDVAPQVAQPDRAGRRRGERQEEGEDRLGEGAAKDALDHGSLRVIAR